MLPRLEKKKPALTLRLPLIVIPIPGIQFSHFLMVRFQNGLKCTETTWWPRKLERKLHHIDDKAKNLLASVANVEHLLVVTNFGKSNIDEEAPNYASALSSLCVFFNAIKVFSTRY